MSWVAPVRVNPSFSFQLVHDYYGYDCDENAWSLAANVCRFYDDRDRGWGAPEPGCYSFPTCQAFQILKKIYLLNVLKHINICQVSLQLSCVDTVKYERDI